MEKGSEHIYAEAFPLCNHFILLWKAYIILLTRELVVIINNPVVHVCWLNVFTCIVKLNVCIFRRGASVGTSGPEH